MRAVVGHLTRNFVIRGDGLDDWGCHILIGGFMDTNPDTDEQAYRRGIASL